MWKQWWGFSDRDKLGYLTRWKQTRLANLANWWTVAAKSVKNSCKVQLCRQRRLWEVDMICDISTATRNFGRQSRVKNNRLPLFPVPFFVIKENLCMKSLSQLSISVLSNFYLIRSLHTTLLLDLNGPWHVNGIIIIIFFVSIRKSWNTKRYLCQLIAHLIFGS